MSICGTFSQSGIANGQQDQVAAGYKNNDPPPISVTCSQQPDGTWTVTAEWPPCSEGVTITHTANNIPEQ